MAQVKKFQPEAIWLDGLWPGAFARYLSDDMGLPYFYRSHNVEHRYMARQASLARTFTYRMRLQLALVGLESFERSVLMGATDVFDISVDDLRFWQRQGLKRGHWLPPITQFPSGTASEVELRYDAVFVGNLHTPNNVDGLRWLMVEVWPKVVAQRPQAGLLISGSAPADEIVALVDATPGVHMLANPVDVWPVYGSARVLVNPMRHGSGVNIKSVEMLQLFAPIVSTSVGVGGLPDDIKAQFHVADDASAFAAAIVKALDAGHAAVDRVTRRQAQAAFSPSAIEGALTVIRQSLHHANGRAVH